MDEDVLAALELAAPGQGEVDGEVVHRQRGADLERHGVGQREDHRLGHRDRLGEGAEHREGGDAVARTEGAALGGLAHDARALGARHEGQVRAHLVEPAAHEDVREADPGLVDVDEDVAGSSVGSGTSSTLTAGRVRRGS